MAKLTPPKNFPCPPLKIDTLDLFCGGGIRVNDSIELLQPTVRDIRAFGEETYIKTIITLCSIPSDYKSELDDMGKSYMEITDFEMFFMLTRDMGVDKTRMILGDIDLSRMELATREGLDDFVMLDAETGLIIDRMLYTILVTYIRMMHGLEYKPEYAANTYTRRALVDEARLKRAREKAQPKPYQPYIGNMVITLVCAPECKYDSNTIQDIGICELILSYQQIAKAKNALALLQGSYSGMVDVSKIDKSRFSWVFEGTQGYMTHPSSPSEQKA